jgi:hypothetical protein
MARVAPSERFRMQLDEALAGVGEEQDPVEMIGRSSSTRCKINRAPSDSSA